MDEIVFMKHDGYCFDQKLIHVLFRKGHRSICVLYELLQRIYKERREPLCSQKNMISAIRVFTNASGS